MKILYIVGDPGTRLQREAPFGDAVHVFSTIKAFRNLGCEVMSFLSAENTEERELHDSYTFSSFEASTDRETSDE